MIDPLISLAFSMHARPGTYAVLLGSGVSRSASIPTGWEVMLGLIEKLAQVEGEKCEPDPEAWFMTKYGCKPTYSGLLEMVAKSPAERSSLLQQYFEPTDSERESGLKVPTKAHHALARLVKSSHVKVILTTNFDCLMEQALNAVGITPTVIDNPDAADGAMPMIHNPCTLVKLHGDYRDLRTKNTPSELEEYDHRINSLLDRVLDEFGLIICGWSSESDPALRKAFIRCKNRRFTTYWAAHNGHLKLDAEELAKSRAAEKISIKGADDFFQELAEKIEALARIDQPHPLSAKIAMAQAKKYLSEPKYRIQLHDLLKQEVEKILDEIGVARYPVDGIFKNEDVVSRIKAFGAISEAAVAIMATGCNWGGEEHVPSWISAINRLANPGPLPTAMWSQQRNQTMQRLRAYPAVLMLYAGGITAVASGHYDTLFKLLSKPKTRSIDYGHSECLLDWLIRAFQDVDRGDIFKVIPNLEEAPLARSVWLRHALREPLREFLPDDETYIRTFDRYEAVQSLCAADIIDLAIPGEFIYRYRRCPDESVLTEIVNEQQSEGTGWRLFKGGFFQGKPERWSKALTCVLEKQKHFVRW